MAVNNITSSVDTGLSSGSPLPETKKPAFHESCIKTHWFAVYSPGGMAAIGFVAILAGAVAGVAITGIVVLCVPSCAIIALGIGAGSGAALGLALTPAILYTLQNKFDRPIPQILQNNLHEELEESRKAYNAAHPHAPVPACGEYSCNDGFMTPGVNESRDCKLELLRHAEQSIEWSPNYFGGKIFDEAMDIIEERMNVKPELRVHIVCNFEYINKSHSQRIQRMKNAFNPRFNILVNPLQFQFTPNIKTRENHSKMLIVDGKYFAVGGTSMYDRGMGIKDMTKEQRPNG